MHRKAAWVWVVFFLLFPSLAFGIEDEPTIERASELREDIRPVGEREREEMGAPSPRDDMKPVTPQDIRQKEENFRNREEELFQKYEKKFEALRQEFAPDTQWGASEEEWQRTWEKLTPEQQARIREVEGAFTSERNALGEDRKQVMEGVEGEYLRQMGSADRRPEEIQGIESELAKHLRQSPEETRAGELREYEEQLSRYRSELEQQEREVRAHLGGEEADRIVQKMREQFQHEAERHQMEIEKRHEMRLGDSRFMYRDYAPDRRTDIETRPYQEFQQQPEFQQFDGMPVGDAQIQERLMFMENFYRSYVEEKNRELGQTTNPIERQMIQKEMEMSALEYERQKALLEGQLTQ